MQYAYSFGNDIRLTIYFTNFSLVTFVLYICFTIAPPQYIPAYNYSTEGPILILTISSTTRVSTTVDS